MVKRLFRKRMGRSMKRISRKRSSIQRSRFQGEVVHRKINVDFKVFADFTMGSTQGIYSLSDVTASFQYFIGLISSQGGATGNTGETLYNSFLFREMANLYAFYKINGASLQFRLSSIPQTAFLTLPTISLDLNAANATLSNPLQNWDFDDNLKIQVNNTSVNGIKKYYSMPGVYFNSGTYQGDPLHSDTRYTTFPICGSKLWISTLNASQFSEPNANGIIGLNAVLGFNSAPFVATAPMANVTYEVGICTVTFYVSFCQRQNYNISVPLPSSLVKK